MDKIAVAERLRALASGNTRRSKAARLRDVVDDVELALAAGVPRADVLKELKAFGLDMTLATFETTLRRIRRAKRVPNVPPHSVPPPAPAAAPSNPHHPSGVSHDPADLDRIAGSNPNLSELAKYAKRRKT